ncbi:MAG: VCBS repeat-containing protein [Pyrinomonadaceae bacterium]
MKVFGTVEWLERPINNPQFRTVFLTVAIGLAGLAGMPGAAPAQADLSAYPHKTNVIKAPDRTAVVQPEAVTPEGNPNPVPQPAVLDFDGDGKTDEVVARGSIGTVNTWYIQASTAGFIAVPWGLFGADFDVPADYDGDHKWDIAVYRSNPNTFFILQSASNTLRIERFGIPGDFPMATQDFDGDGKADPTVTRFVGGQLNWYILRSTLSFTGFTFGNADDLPVRGDFDGDRKADVAVYRKGSGSPANTFFVLPSGGGPIRSQTFGVPGNDAIIPGDFDGDGRSDYAVYRGGMIANSGTWYWLRSSNGALRSAVFGNGQDDIPTPGDYDGDGKTDPSVWRPSGTPTFHHLCSTTGYFATIFGLGPDNPVSFSLQVRN